MKKFLLGILILLVGAGSLLGNKISGTYEKRESGLWGLTYGIYTDSIKVTKADTITYNGIYVMGSDLHSAFVKTDDDSIKIEYREVLKPGFNGDWILLDSLPSGAEYYTLYLDYCMFLQARIIGLGNDSTVMKFGMLIGSIR